MILHRRPFLAVTASIVLAAVIALTLLATGALSGSGVSCSSWRAHALTEEQHAYRSAVSWARAYVNGFPIPPSLTEQRGLVEAQYRVELLPVAAADSKGRWAHAARTCSTPSFTPSSS